METKPLTLSTTNLAEAVEYVSTLPTGWFVEAVIDSDLLVGQTTGERNIATTDHYSYLACQVESVASISEYSGLTVAEIQDWLRKTVIFYTDGLVIFIAASA
jgi:hypothetical protein